MLETTKFQRHAFDGDIDVNNLPAIPWSRNALGDALFGEMMRITGAGQTGDYAKQENPNIDPRTFGRCRAFALARSLGLIARRKDLAEERERKEAFQVLLDEGEELQRRIDEGLPGPTPSPRNPKAPALTPTITRRKVRGQLPTI